LTRTRLRELLRYDPNTGQFHWRKDRSSHSARSAKHLPRQQNGRCIRIDGRVYNEHQLAWLYMTGRWAKPTIDHRDGDCTNNRWNNLRRATHSQNNANRRRPRNNTSGYKGVYRGRRPGQWYAQIGKNGKMIFLGVFSSRQTAHAAYVAAAGKYYGEFARAE
jgi:hypothetical protein